MIKEIIDLHNKSAHLWMNLQEDEKLQELEQKEEGVNIVLQDLKQRKKVMKILNN
jgi:plasmid maintenance system antidote protein VapI